MAKNNYPIFKALNDHMLSLGILICSPLSEQILWEAAVFARLKVPCISWSEKQYQACLQPQSVVKGDGANTFWSIILFVTQQGDKSQNKECNIRNICVKLIYMIIYIYIYIFLLSFIGTSLRVTTKIKYTITKWQK